MEAKHTSLHSQLLTGSMFLPEKITSKLLLNHYPIAKKKDYCIYAWCLMPSHLHILVSTEQGFELSDVIRDFKKYTSKRIIEQIKTEPESRREWLLNQFERAGKGSKKIKGFKFWQDGNHAIEVYNPKFTWQKIRYIHQNPVEEMLVAVPEDYYFSSARNYAGLSNVLDVYCITPC